MAAKKTKGTAGRPTEYLPEFCQQAADLCACGATDFQVAESLGVSVRTIYRWQAQHPEFCQALKAGKEAADERVIRSLYHRAVGYTYNAVKVLQNSGAAVIVPYVEHVPPDVGAATLWLTNRQGKDWKSKNSTALSNPDGSPLNFTMYVPPKAE